MILWWHVSTCSQQGEDRFAYPSPYSLFRWEIYQYKKPFSRLSKPRVETYSASSASHPQSYNSWSASVAKNVVESLKDLLLDFFCDVHHLDGFWYFPAIRFHLGGRVPDEILISNYLELIHWLNKSSRNECQWERAKFEKQRMIFGSWIHGKQFLELDIKAAEDGRIIIGGSWVAQEALY